MGFIYQSGESHCEKIKVGRGVAIRIPAKCEVCYLITADCIDIS